MIIRVIMMVNIKYDENTYYCYQNVTNIILMEINVCFVGKF